MQKTFPLRYWHRFGLAAVGIFLMSLMASCSTERTIVSKVTSPDANNEAQIVSVDNAGPGQNSSSIVVQFKNIHADNFKDISVFNGNGVIEPTVHATWMSNATLLITYGNATVGFQAVKIGNVSIEYEEKKSL